MNQATPQIIKQYTEINCRGPTKRFFGTLYRIKCIFVIIVPQGGVQ